MSYFKWYLKPSHRDAQGFAVLTLGPGRAVIVGTGWGTTGLPPSVHGQQGLVAKFLSKPSSIIVWKPAWLRRAEPVQAAHTHTHTQLFVPPPFCSTASTCPHNPNPGLKTKQGWRGKKGQMDSTLLLRAWSNLHCYNSSSWDSQKNTFNISFFSCFFPHKTFFPQLGRALTMTSIAEPGLKPRSFQFCLFL